MMNILVCKSGYSRPTFEGEAKFRPMTVDEAKSLRHGDHVEFMDKNGDVRDCRVNGKPKTWKTRPTHVKVPMKYGMYECFYAENYASDSEAVTNLVVRI